MHTIIKCTLSKGFQMQTSEKICLISAIALHKFLICCSSFAHTNTPQRENYYWAFPKLFICEILPCSIHNEEGENFLCLFDGILLVWCSVKKRLEASYFWRVISVFILVVFLHNADSDHPFSLFAVQKSNQVQTFC